MYGFKAIRGDDVLLGKKPVNCFFSEVDDLTFELKGALENMASALFSLFTSLLGGSVASYKNE